MSPEDQVRLLIADDEKPFLKALVTYLEAPHREIITASTGTQAIEILKQAAPEIVITDLVMPGCDGLSVLREALARGRKTLVIMMTGYGSIDTAIRAIKEGAFDYKAKPFLLEEMGLCVAKAEHYLGLLRERDALMTEKARLMDEVKALRAKLESLAARRVTGGEEDNLVPLSLKASRAEEALSRYKSWEPGIFEKDELTLLRGLLEKGLITELQWRKLLRRLSSSEPIQTHFGT